MVMCSEPVMRTPASGFSFAYLRRIAISPGISCSAMVISLRPQSASERSATLYSVAIRLAVAVPILLLVSTNPDTLILQLAHEAVNSESPASRCRSHPAPHSPAAWAGGAVRRGSAGNHWQRPKSRLYQPSPVEAGWAGSGPPYR